MSKLITYTQPQTEVLWLKVEGNVCEAASGSGFENFTENGKLNW